MAKFAECFGVNVYLLVLVVFIFAVGLLVCLAEHSLQILDCL